jgi:hypothetical protein
LWPPLYSSQLITARLDFFHLVAIPLVDISTRWHISLLAFLSVRFPPSKFYEVVEHQNTVFYFIADGKEQQSFKDNCRKVDSKNSFLNCDESDSAALLTDTKLREGKHNCSIRS